MSSLPLELRWRGTSLAAELFQRSKGCKTLEEQTADHECSVVAIASFVAGGNGGWSRTGRVLMILTRQESRSVDVVR